MTAAPRRKLSRSEETRRSLFFSGYTWPADTLKHRTRLSKGVIQFALLDFIWQRCEGRKRKKEGPNREPVPYWCVPFTSDDAAVELECTSRQIEEDLEDLRTRRVIQWEKTKREYEAHVCIEEWPSLQSVPRGPQLVKKTADSAPEDPEDETQDQPKKAAQTAITFPVEKLREGKPGRRHKIESVVKAVQVTVTGPGEYQAESSLISGDLRVSVFLTPHGMNELTRGKGSVLPIEAAKPQPAAGTPQSGRSIPEDVLVSAAAGQLAEKVAAIGCLLPSDAARSITQALANVPGDPQAVQDLYLQQLEAKTRSFGRKGGKLETGACVNLAREMPRLWTLHQKALQGEDDMPPDQRALLAKMSGRRL